MTRSQEKFKANMEDHSNLYSMDHMVGKEQGLFEGKRLQIPRVKNECIKKLYFWCYSSNIDRMDQYLEFLHFLGDNM